MLADGEEGKECPVCMEPFTVDEIVSWSPTKYCDHVFHHECIKEWLLHHENCPYCRVTFLPVDKDTATANNDDTAATTTNTDESSSSTTTSIFASSKPRTVRELTALAQQRTQRLMTTYYCLDEGLVTLLDRPSPPTAAAAGKYNNDAENSNTNHGNSNKKKLTRAMKQLLSTGIQLGELSEMRGSKIRATVDDDNNVAASNNTVTVNVVASTDDEGDDNETAPAAALSSGSTPPPPPPPQALNFAHAVVDIEMCMTQLRALSNNSHDDDDNVASGSSR